MKYEDFLYKLICLLTDWGTWNSSIEIYYEDKKYSPGDNNAKFSDLKNVSVDNILETDRIFTKKCSPNSVMVIKLNSRLINMFTYGVLVTNLVDVSISR